MILWVQTILASNLLVCYIWPNPIMRCIRRKRPAEDAHAQKDKKSIPEKPKVLHFTVCVNALKYVCRAQLAKCVAKVDTTKCGILPFSV